MRGYKGPPCPGIVRLGSTQEIAGRGQGLQFPVCNTPVPDIYHGHFAALVQHLIDHAIIADADPVKVLCAGKVVCIMRNRFACRILTMFKNVRDDFFWDFPYIFFMRSS